MIAGESGRTEGIERGVNVGGGGKFLVKRIALSCGTEIRLSGDGCRSQLVNPSRMALSEEQRSEKGLGRGRRKRCIVASSITKFSCFGALLGTV